MNAGVATNAGGSSRAYRSTMTTSNGPCDASVADRRMPRRRPERDVGADRQRQAVEHQLEQLGVELDDTCASRAGSRRCSARG